MFMDISTVSEILQNEKAEIQRESVKWEAAFYPGTQLLSVFLGCHFDLLSQTV